MVKKRIEGSIMYRFGMLFMELRGSRGLTREEAEDALGLRQGTVSNWEMGYTLPDEETLEDISRYFSVDICFLTREEWDD